MLNKWIMLGLLALVCELFWLGQMTDRQKAFDSELALCMQTTQHLIEVNLRGQSASTAQVQKTCDAYKNDETIQIKAELLGLWAAKGENSKLSHQEAWLMLDTFLSVAPMLDSAFIAIRTRLNDLSAIEQSTARQEDHDAVFKLRALCVNQAFTHTLKQLQAKTRKSHSDSMFDDGMFIVTPERPSIHAGDSFDAEVRLRHYPSSANNITVQVNNKAYPVIAGKGKAQIVLHGNEQILQTNIMVKNPLTKEVKSYRKQFQISCNQ